MPDPTIEDLQAEIAALREREVWWTFDAEGMGYTVNLWIGNTMYWGWSWAMDGPCPPEALHLMAVLMRRARVEVPVGQEAAFRDFAELVLDRKGG